MNLPTLAVSFLTPPTFLSPYLDRPTHLVCYASDESWQHQSKVVFVKRIHAGSYLLTSDFLVSLSNTIKHEHVISGYEKIFRELLLGYKTSTASLESTECVLVYV